MMRFFLFLFLIAMQLTACSQKTARPAANKSDNKDIKVGGSCEGCEAIYESPIPFAQLDYVDTLPSFYMPGPKLDITGTIYKSDGKTPAAGVILYVYHTDQQGIYPKKADEKGWAQRHGYLRGWVKTNAQGQYRFLTTVPASYPNSTNQKHIHPTIKEPGKSEYWIDEYVFSDDPLLPEAERNRPNPVGGKGVLTTVMKDGMLRASRDIILGLDVRDYR
ncbi:MAG: intradiol ring-cleavage dioxygenase [Chitinophagaceae bacterium]|nr:intradiol ring-cleavage dioxygenase [Chitinophagaceae bacterium]